MISIKDKLYEEGFTPETIKKYKISNTKLDEEKTTATINQDDDYLLKLLQLFVETGRNVAHYQYKIIEKLVSLRRFEEAAEYSKSCSFEEELELIVLLNKYNEVKKNKNLIVYRDLYDNYLEALKNNDMYEAISSCNHLAHTSLLIEIDRIMRNNGNTTYFHDLMYLIYTSPTKEDVKVLVDEFLNKFGKKNFINFLHLLIDNDDMELLEEYLDSIYRGSIINLGYVDERLENAIKNEDIESASRDISYYRIVPQSKTNSEYLFFIYNEFRYKLTKEVYPHLFDNFLLKESVLELFNTEDGYINGLTLKTELDVLKVFEFLKGYENISYMVEKDEDETYHVLLKTFYSVTKDVNEYLVDIRSLLENNDITNAISLIKEAMCNSYGFDPELLYYYRQYVASSKNKSTILCLDRYLKMHEQELLTSINNIEENDLIKLVLGK